MIDFAKFSHYQPAPYLLLHAHKTGSPFIFLYKRPHIVAGRPLLVILFGPGGVGKDSIARGILGRNGIAKVRTATSRPRRVLENEREDAYIWIRSQKPDESEEEYVAHLVAEYDLLEHISFNGFVYGTPYISLKMSLASSIALMLVTSDGVKAVTERFSEQANIISVFIVPENLEQLYARISKREHPDQRMMISIDEIKRAPEYANYYLYNPTTFNGCEGLPQVQKALLELIEHYASIK